MEDVAYLGDGVYARYEHGMICLSLDAQPIGAHVCKIYLEPFVLDALDRFRKTIEERGHGATGDPSTGIGRPSPCETPALFDPFNPPASSANPVCACGSAATTFVTGTWYCSRCWIEKNEHTHEEED